MPEPDQTTPVIKLPIGPWPTWDACVAAQKKAGHSQEAAERICGALQDKLKASPDADVDQLTADVVAELGLDRRIGGSPKLCGRPLWGAAIKLALAAEDVEPNKLVWVQVAKSGEWKGHAEGPFTLDRKLFEELQRNFRAHVNYRAEPSPPDGRVIQWDFHHACEEHPSTLAVQGAPAQGWIYDVALGDQVPKDKLSEKAQAALAASEEAGVETFWALTEWLEPAASYVAAGKYQWSSIAIYPDSKDPITGEDVGWWFASCALTNRPFIEGMAPMSIAASRLFAAREPKRLGRYYDPWDVPATIGEAFGRLKDILEMGELATVVDVAGELAKLKSYADGAAPPPGVDVDKLIHQIRQLLQLELLTDSNTIFARCEELLARASAESQAAPPAVATTRDPMSDPVDPNKMLLETIARRLKVPSKPEDVQKAILAELEAGAAAKEKLGKLYQALGVEDYQAAADRLIENAQQIARLEQIMPELASLRQLQVDEEEKDVEDDMAMAAARFGAGWETIKEMVAHYRTGGVSLDRKDPAIAVAETDTFEQRLGKLTELGRRLAARKVAKAAFDAKLPRVPAGQEHIFASIATDPSPKPGAPPIGSAQLARAQVGPDGVLRLMASAPASSSGAIAPASPPGDGAADLSNIRAEVEAHDGPNFGAKCYAYIRAKKNAAGVPLNYDDDQAKACVLAQQLRGQLSIAS